MEVIDISAPNEPAYIVLAQLHERAFRSQGDTVWDTDAFKSLLETPGTFCHLCTLNNTPVGFCLYRFIAGEAEILTLAVHPSFQGQAIATNLLANIIQKLQASGGEKLFLEVRKDNHAAINLYEKNNFKCIGVRPKYYKQSDGTKIDAHIFSLTLK